MITKKTGKIRINKYSVVSIRDYEEFIKGTYDTYKEAYRKAKSIDSNLTTNERIKGYRTEVWTNYNPKTGTIQTIHTIGSKKIKG